ncbi:unnamed protein product [Brassicogethes aeneus]|uniref:Epoxide hydrolase n=1 Tax=Brassicogethes aeneus TaxID=1431903 RepID=A0A9P0B7F5_BRAAE|nr:unnamed protein product [Brassicogethes aeneus]
MGKCGIILLLLAAFAGFIGFKVKNALFEVPELPKLEDTWWGPRDPSREDKAITPFKINVAEDVLKDLKHRLDIIKPFTPALQGTKQDYGMHPDLLQKIINHWKNKYDWREREKFLNQYPQFTVSVQGLRIHYIHIKPKNVGNKKVIPMLLLHGWPGSVREFYEAIPHLSKPQEDFVFELIIPSLPGYGFSEAAVKPGLGAAQMAQLFKNFMDRLGFQKYYIQGGDWGAIIVQHMAQLFPEKLIGVHSNMCFVNTPLSNMITWFGAFFPSLVVTSDDEASKVYPLACKYSYILQETGYMHLQASKPDTIGFALKDNPAGLAAYIIEKFSTWTNKDYRDRLDGGLQEKFTYEQLLDNIMIYHVTGSITTSVRLYAESFNKAQMSMGLSK